MRKKLPIILLLGLFVQFSFAQTREISGTVISAEDNAPIPGVSILVKGANIGTVSDLDGKYMLDVPQGNETLIFSFIGMATREVNTGDRSVIDLSMSPNVNALNEVVVTAIGIEREKKALGYAVSEVDSEEITQRSEPDVIRALNGKVAGVLIQGSGGVTGGNTNITIRGSSSLTGNNQPLFVVDGIPFDNSTQGYTDQGGNSVANRAFDIDPNNVASMTVLKGAAAAALYGSRAQNGVVIITTKSGSGASRKGLEVNYSTSFGIEEVAKLPDYQNEYGQGGNGNVYIENYFGSFGAPYTAYDSVPHPYTNPALGPYLNSPSYQNVASRGDNVLYQPFTEKYRNFFNTGKLQEHAISVQSGGEKTNLSAGLSWMDNTGIIPNSSVTRISANLGGNATLDNGLKLSAGLNYVSTVQNNPALGSGNFGGFNQSASQLVLWAPTSFDLDGYPYQREEDGGAMYYRTANNPYWVADNSMNESNVDRYFGNVKLGYDIADWINVAYQLGFNAYTDRRFFMMEPGGFGSAIEQSGFMRRSTYYNAELDGNLLININKALNDDFYLRTITGWNINQRTNTASQFGGNGVIERGIQSFTNTSSQFIIDDRFVRRRFAGLFTDISLAYQEWAFVNLTARNDWSSTLPEDNRSYFYPGVSTSLILSDALSLNSSFLDYAKIRAGIGQVGNDADPYLTSNNFLLNQPVNGSGGATQFPFNNQFGTVNGSAINSNRGIPLLKPELTTETEVGAELLFFKQRIGLDFTYYNRSTENGITAIDVPPSSGSATQVVNIGKVRNRGIEVGLNLKVIERPNGFNWNIFTAFTRNRNEVLELQEGVDQIVLTSSAGSSEIVQVAHRNGQPFGVLIGRKAIRDAAGNLLIDGLPGTTYGKYIDNPEPQIIGDPNPDFVVGITNDFSYKGLTLDLVLDWVQGGDLYSKSNREIVGRGLTHDSGDRMVSRIMPGYIAARNEDGSLARDENGNYLAAVDASGNPIRNNINITNFNWWYDRGGFGWNAAEEFHTFDATVLRLRELALNYNFPSRWLDKTPFGSARIGMSGRNLWFITPNMHEGLNLDPETSSFPGLRGIDFIGVPSARRYSMNLSFTF
ncbi:TonB-linked outer membrane protein, SusC/RagA family [Cyclobacterium lianum]|uniref:TonB-linked outer membrane protein, SusC/RagA family n=1 Tax=Cyclobacterium lianum TaxID=388280 RepID=A0A1M7IFP8_9BACT|nr:SusC/RagA family TonB-linked outer membrane protein [Cyclobacterium lianum]SHM39495.1 TonB-linked outer membrane protein, SusC/RagA family [Cyclobacterium lianum]